MGQATLRTDRLLLEPLADEHLADEIALDALPEVMRYLDAPRTAEQVTARHRERLAAARDGLGFWAGSVAGSFAGWWLLEPGERPGEAELGYRLRPEFWRRGLASEGARALLEHGFAELGLRRVFAQTMAVNEASRATMASVGLRYVRTFHQDWPVPLPGAEHGEVEYAVTRDEWR